MMHHHHSLICKVICCITWLVTALASINMLTAMYDYNFILYIGSMMPGLVMPMVWLIGLSGLVSLVMWVKITFMCCEKCGSYPCKCNGHMSCKCNNPSCRCPNSMSCTCPKM